MQRKRSECLQKFSLSSDLLTCVTINYINSTSDRTVEKKEINNKVLHV